MRAGPPTTRCSTATPGASSWRRVFSRRRIALQTAQVEQDVGHSVVGDDEPVTASDIEPFHETGDLEYPDIRFWTLLVKSSAGPDGSAPRHVAYSPATQSCPCRQYRRLIKSRELVQARENHRVENVCDVGPRHRNSAICAVEDMRKVPISIDLSASRLRRAILRDDHGRLSHARVGTGRKKKCANGSRPIFGRK